jgi:PIN domain nuclease of toxin-antitoxin system
VDTARPTALEQRTVAPPAAIGSWLADVAGDDRVRVVEAEVAEVAEVAEIAEPLQAPSDRTMADITHQREIRSFVISLP